MKEYDTEIQREKLEQSWKIVNDYYEEILDQSRKQKKFLSAIEYPGSSQDKALIEFYKNEYECCTKIEQNTSEILDDFNSEYNVQLRELEQKEESRSECEGDNNGQNSQYCSR